MKAEEAVARAYFGTGRTQKRLKATATVEPLMVRADCNHEVPRTELYHICGLGADEGIDVCFACYQAMSVGLYMAVSRNIERRWLQMYEEASWYLAEKDHQIAVLQETIEMIDNDQVEL